MRAIDNRDQAWRRRQLFEDRLDGLGWRGEIAVQAEVCAVARGELHGAAVPSSHEERVTAGSGARFQVGAHVADEDVNNSSSAKKCR